FLFSKDFLLFRSFLKLLLFLTLSYANFGACHFYYTWTALKMQFLSGCGCNPSLYLLKYLKNRQGILYKIKSKERGPTMSEETYTTDIGSCSPSDCASCTSNCSSAGKN